MSKTIEPLRGVHDVLPTQISLWQHLERVTREVFAAYGYEEFRVPVIEQTQLFKRSIGDFTDIVEKEMFSFVDQGEDTSRCDPKPRPESSGRSFPTGCCARIVCAFGAWARCSGVNARKRDVIASFTKSTLRLLGSKARMSTRR